MKYDKTFVYVIIVCKTNNLKRSVVEFLMYVGNVKLAQNIFHMLNYYF